MVDKIATKKKDKSVDDGTQILTEKNMDIKIKNVIIDMGTKGKSAKQIKQKIEEKLDVEISVKEIIKIVADSMNIQFTFQSDDKKKEHRSKKESKKRFDMRKLNVPVNAKKKIKKKPIKEKKEAM